MSNIKHFNEVFGLLDQGALLWSVDHLAMSHDRYRVIRTDNGKGLGTSSIPAPPMQNSQFIDLVYRVAQSLDLQIDRSGYLLNGHYVFVNIPLQSKNVAGERLTCSLNVRMQHSGQRRITVGVTDVFKGNLIIHHDHTQCSSLDTTVIGLCRNLQRAIEMHEEVIDTYKRMSNTEASEEMALRALTPVVRDAMHVKDPLHPLEHEAEWIKVLESDVEEEISNCDNALGALKGFIRYCNRRIRPDVSGVENRVILRNSVSQYAYRYLRQWVNQQDLMTYHSLS